MTPTQASDLLWNQYIDATEKTVWADLGAGSGTFTLALTSLLQPGSVIHALDTNKAALNAIPKLHNQVTIETHVADFIDEKFPFGKINGVLMANSLHYVRDKAAFLEKLKKHLTEKNYLLIIEYDTDQPVPTWVPYPISYHSLTTLFGQLGYQSIHKLQERPSIYGRATMYATLIIS